MRVKLDLDDRARLGSAHVTFVVDDAVARAHAQMETEGRHPSALRPRGFRCDCPRCGAGRRRHDRVSVAPGETRAVVAYCFACSTDVSAHFAGASVELDPVEVARRRAQREREERAARDRLELVAGAVRPFDDGFPLSPLMWDPARLPGAGMYGDQVAFVVRTDNGAVQGIDLYAAPFTRERAAVDAEGGRKLTAIKGGRRGLWPRPRDVPASPHLPGLLLAVEGPGGGATVLSLGFSAISFPSAAGIGARDAGRLARVGWERVLVLADADGDGRRAARASALALRGAGLRAKAIDLAPGRSDGTDVADLAREHPDVSAARAWLLRALEPFTKEAK